MAASAYPTRHVGPNVRKLIFAKMAKDAVQDGEGLVEAINFLGSPDRVRDSFRGAAAWIFAAIDLVKESPDNPYGGDDEAIAAAILKGIESKKGAQA